MGRKKLLPIGIAQEVASSEAESRPGQAWKIAYPVAESVGGLSL